MPTRSSGCRLRAGTYDAIVVDFPDPSNYSIGKLFSATFYRRLNEVLAPDGWAVIQSTSPFVARKAFWCVARTLESQALRPPPIMRSCPRRRVGFRARGPRSYHPPRSLPTGLRFLTPECSRRCCIPTRHESVPTQVNRLDNQVLVRYFESEWGQYLAE